MITTIKIQPQMDCNYICQRIHQAILQYQKDNQNVNDAMLVIDIRKPYDDDNLIPKLEFKE
jgi:GTP-binding protein EngB required for normal cell division